MIEIHTDRTHLRPWTMDDLEAFHSIWGDDRVIWWGASTDLPGSAGKLASSIEISAACEDGLGWFAVTLSNGTIAGNVMLQPARPMPHEIEIGWHFARDYQDEGFATEAASALLEHAWQRTEADRIVAIIVTANEPAKRVATKLGMHADGTVIHDGITQDVWVIDRPTD